MEAVYINNDLVSGMPAKEVFADFFKSNTLDSAQVMFWKLFQCWTLKDCIIKAEVSNEEVALFFDQLNNLLAAVYLLHQAKQNPVNKAARRKP